MERTNTLIIGAGAAGLAVSACLRHSGIPFVLLEKGDQIGQAWHDRYDRLHLHTHKRFSRLPYRAFPYDFPRYPSRLQVATYLDHYARAFRITPKFGQEVTAVTPLESAWHVATQNGEYLSHNVVIAGGLSHTPYIPEYPGLNTFTGTTLHTAQFENGRAFAEKSVLVVGFGNSAAEVALDLHEHGAQVTLSVRGPVNVVPRDTLGLSTQALSVLLSIFPPRIADALSGNLRRLLVGDITKQGLKQMPYGPLTQISRGESTPLLDIGTMEKIKSGKIKVEGAIQSIQQQEVQFENHSSAPFDAIIFGTGFSPGVTFLKNSEGVLNDDGRPRASGSATGMQGLYFCGYYNAPAGLLRQIGKEAKQIGKLIKKDAARRGSIPRIRMDREVFMN